MNTYTHTEQQHTQQTTTHIIVRASCSSRLERSWGTAHERCSMPVHNAMLPTPSSLQDAKRRGTPLQPCESEPPSSCHVDTAVPEHELRFVINWIRYQLDSLSIGFVINWITKREGPCTLQQSQLLRQHSRRLPPAIVGCLHCQSALSDPEAMGD